ncbi:hypothetical protein AAHA92_09893 [Salvia divinorum]|uniref:Myb/SANT-like domain-containing protein n=1 Tax=Salvia divinorum TaxID=28513 RepID=A0ABD1HTQ5_SALDI
MIRLRDVSNWSGCIIPTHFLMEASDIVYETLRIHFSRDELYDRLQCLENRFRSFNVVLAIPGVVWDEKPNTMAASDDIWRSIFKHDKIAGAYYYKGEPEYRNMPILFGYATIKSEVEKTVVIISDTTREIIHISDNDDAEHSLSTEVVSPVFVPKPKSKCKLFDV